MEKLAIFSLFQSGAGDLRDTETCQMVARKSYAGYTPESAPLSNVNHDRVRRKAPGENDYSKAAQP
ncbi:uncharacterized protein N7503_008868 [Penicillium pulvis]|uniref:uncharacterized protein n=1 Tax=Penicillium pulvis TaxID=1562058 RepID=UPI002548E433|nr:uncharacterized protein N7503_008868 [Penicillium pulvis]KAJ5792890.1 hypothetical protein N7503_008868 [Penicillium pulvis]